MQLDQEQPVEDLWERQHFHQLEHRWRARRGCLRLLQAAMVRQLQLRFVGRLVVLLVVVELLVTESVSRHPRPHRRRHHRHRRKRRRKSLLRSHRLLHRRLLK